MDRTIEVADGVFVRRHDVLDLTLGLVLGDERCLAVDSGLDEVHGAEWLAAIRAVTSLPVVLLITHAHWDHFFGTAAFPPGPVWAHPRCAHEIAGNADAHRVEGMRHFRKAGEHDMVRRLAMARVVTPTHRLHGRMELDLGGRSVTLLHPGRGHTAGDLVAHVPDAGVLFAGDLVEQGAPPSVGPDAFQDAWVSTLDTLVALEPNVVVPGHGDPVDRAFVTGQRDFLTGAGST